MVLKLCLGSFTVDRATKPLHCYDWFVASGAPERCNSSASGPKAVITVPINAQEIIDLQYLIKWIWKRGSHVKLGLVICSQLAKSPHNMKSRIIVH